jgi:hypothetical protein
VSAIIKGKPHLTKKTPSINHGHFTKITVDLKTEAVETGLSQNVLVKLLSEKFLRLNSFDGEFQVRQ